MSLQNPHWYDYLNPFFWIELVTTAQVIRGANGLKNSLRRTIPELKKEEFVLIKLQEDKNA